MSLPAPWEVGVRDQREDGPAAPEARLEPEALPPRELFQQMSHIAITMSYDLIDKLRFFEKETLKLPEAEIAGRVPHLKASLEALRAAYLKFAEVDF
jgi:hypothetical protein